ncbi:MAG: hypothetical protein JNL57_11665 [Bacteroidetes bacterium]|nr:hypothetical protein [Bacteroidota bacterium]
MKMRNLLKYFLLFTLVLAGRCEFAQSQSVNVTVTILPPYDPNLFTYTEDENKVLITLTNISASVQNIKLGGRFRSMDDRISVSTNPDYQPDIPIVLNPAETRLLTATELYNIFPSESSIIAVGITREELIRTRRLPAATYQLCITAYDFNAQGYSVPLSAAIPSGCSAPFRVGLINAPEMLSFGGVNCGERLNYSDLQNFLIQWTIPPEAPVHTRYILEMIELYPEGRNPFDAFESATSPIFFTDSVEYRNNYFYSIANPLMEPGRTYAIRVRATDPTGGLRFANRGYSTPCVIRYGNAGNDRVSIVSSYPTDNEYVPWRYCPIIVKFQPYDNQLYRFNYNMQLQENGITATNRNNDLRWPYGPRESQERATGISIAENASQHIAVNEPNARVAQEFNRGARYRYNVGGYFLHRTTGDRAPLSVSCTDEFISGMGVPVNQEPADESSQDTGLIAFRFQTSDFPTNPLPAFSIVTSDGSGAGRPTSNFFEEKVIERYVLEVSKQRDFSTVYRSVSHRFEPNVTLNQCIAEHNLLNDSIYRSINHSLRVSDTGTYFWRVKWLVDDNDPRSNAYVTGPVWQFRIGARPPEIRTDTARRTPPGCLADCMAPPETDRTPVSTAAVGGTITVGKFSMTITEISWAGTNARGRGHIRVPFMGAPVRVSFSSIQINAANRMISGEVLTETDNSTLVPDALARAVGTFTGLGQEQAQEINQWITTSNRLASQLAGSSPVGMPLGIDNTIDGQRTIVAILGCKFTSSMATLNAMAGVDIPEMGSWISLGANDICFHPGGINFNQGKLYLPRDLNLVYTTDITFSLKAPSLPRDSGTYVSWDCQGFKELSVSGAALFGRNLLVPDADDGSAGPGQVQGRFNFKVQRSGNWLARLDMDRFQVAGLPEWGFEASEAYLDFSDLQNAGSMQYPEGYGGDRTIRWKGFYLKRLAVRLPNEFKTYSAPGRRLTGSINNVLIDGTGFSARFAIENLVRVDDGNLDGWAYSLDTVYLSMVSNNFRNAGLNGQIKLPISTTALKYDASLNRSSAGEFAFEFRIQPADTFVAQIWECQIQLMPSSRISVTIDGRGFAAGTDLTGTVTIAGSRGAPEGSDGMRLDGIGLRGIRFEHFVLSSRGPRYISVGSFAFASEQHSSGGFPLSIDAINITSREGPSMMEFDQSPGPRFGIEFVITLSLTGESSGFHAATKIAFLGKLNLTGERQGWSFSGVNLDSIAVGGTVGCVSIEGSLVFYNSHPTYGKGIRGYLSVEFKPTISVSATVQFGEVRGFRYWYVDAMAIWSPGITLFAGVDLRGIGGGAWYHMRKPEPVPFSRIVAGTAPVSNAAGTSSTGTAYTPDGSVGLGFEARIKIGATGGSSAYHGLITLGAQFIESTGGIERIFLQGDFIFMTESTNRREASASADFLVNYNFVRNEFLASFNVYVNVAGVLQGIGPDNRAGYMEIYARVVNPGERDDWHIYVGTPRVPGDERYGPIGLRLVLGRTELARAEFYFMAGMNLPPMPPLPPEIASRLHVVPERDITNIERGDGFAMGTFVNIGPLGFEIMPFYASLGVGFGFDLSVKKMTSRCEGMPPSATIGANGWYARGQIYGYIQADMGLFVDLFFVKGRFSIFNAQLAAYLQGGFPNPNWVEGAVTGRYEILGGAVSGYCQFEFKEGQKCVPPVENPMAGLELVANLSPEQGATGVDCGVEPTAMYNYSIGRQFSLTVKDINNRDIVRTFRVMERNTKLMGRTVSNVIGGTVALSENDQLVTFYSDSFLAGNTIHFWTTTAYCEELIRGSWSTARDLENREVRKQYTHLFTTAARPDKIRPQDVLYSYPFHDQRFLLQQECRTGLLALKRSMAYLFTRSSSTDYVWTYRVRFTPVEGGEPVFSDLRNYTSLNINFDIPALQNNKVYQVDFIAQKGLTAAGRARQALASAARSNSMWATRPTIRDRVSEARFGGSTLVVHEKTAVAGSKTSEDMVILYTYHFKTSQYNSVADKWNAMRVKPSEKVGWGDLESITYVAEGEGYDEYDMIRHSYVQQGRTIYVSPLVNFSAAWTPRTNIWMQSQMYYVYDFKTWLFSNRLNNPRTSRAFEFTNRTNGIPPYVPVQFSDDSYQASLLQEWEKMSSPPAGSTILARLSNMRPINSGGPLGGFAGFTAANRDTRLYYGIPVITVLHRIETRNWARLLLTYYGYEFLSAEQMQYIENVAYEPYARLQFGNYPVDLSYITPTCGMDPDMFRSLRFNVVLPLR